MASDQHNIVELIERKRDAGQLTSEELHWVVTSYTAGKIPDYQMSAFLMAVLFRAMSIGELAAWTEAMLHSGELIDLGHLPAPKVDKHSTGGVGDKVSIPLAPIVAACGLAVPMISGRGLGHTGGTLDKLESIPGFRTALTPAEFHDVVTRAGIVMAGQSETMVPADRMIYALRDATGTVPSVPLIASSIMSKKLSEGLDALVLDVKVGGGAFMKTMDDALELADTMVGIGKAHQTTVVAVFTAMDQPLGREVGNAGEIAESLDVLEGGGPADLVEVVHRLGSEMLVAGGLTADLTEGRVMMDRAVSSGAAMEKFAEVIVAQGGDPGVLDDRSLLPTAPHVTHVRAPRDGFVTRCDALAVGMAGVRLGAGRLRKEDEIDPGVGITVLRKVGEPVTANEPLCEIRFRDQARVESANELLEKAWQVGDEAGDPGPLILGELR